MPSRELLAWTAVLTVLCEAATLALRFGGGLTAVDFNRSAPLLLQIHHMFWAVPVFAAALALRHRPGLVVQPSRLLHAGETPAPQSNARARLARRLWALGLALMASDLAHHFLVLPLLVGHTGWHWP